MRTIGARKTISKKLRFEVFKRDNFTCQYCGKMAPDVILEVDHINSVKECGTNDIMNLITSCRDCNRGKGCRALSDNQVLKQQQNQLKEINEKRNQLKLMLKWKAELQKFGDEQVEVINKMINNVSEHVLSEQGKRNMMGTINKYGIDEVIESTNISINQYLKTDGISIVVEYIPKICRYRKLDKENPWAYKCCYIKAIMKNRFGIYNDFRTNKMLKELVIDKESYEIVCDIAKSSQNWTKFWEIVNDEFETNY